MMLVVRNKSKSALDGRSIRERKRRYSTVNSAPLMAGVEKYSRVAVSGLVRTVKPSFRTCGKRCTSSCPALLLLFWQELDCALIMAAVVIEISGWH